MSPIGTETRLAGHDDQRRRSAAPGARRWPLAAEADADGDADDVDDHLDPEEQRERSLSAGEHRPTSENTASAPVTASTGPTWRSTKPKYSRSGKKTATVTAARIRLTQSQRLKAAMSSANGSAESEDIGIPNIGGRRRVLEPSG